MFCTLYSSICISSFHTSKVNMSQYTGQKRQSALESTDGFSSAKQTAGIPNPHIPKFVSKVPWYLGNDNQSESSMEHHKGVNRPVLESSEVSTVKGSLGDVKRKFEKGACENCGSKSHKRKDCLERPRKILAKFSNEKLASDDINPNDIDRSTFEGKRDRWRDFDASICLNQPVKTADTDVKSSLLLKEGETFEMATNMRAREDTAKYLFDLSGEDGAHYDPKSRSMRNVEGEKFSKYAPESEQVMKLRKRFAWDQTTSSSSTAKVTEVTNPTQVAKEIAEEEEERKRVLLERKRLLESQYGTS